MCRSQCVDALSQSAISWPFSRRKAIKKNPNLDACARAKTAHGPPGSSTVALLRQWLLTVPLKISATGEMVEVGRAPMAGGADAR